LSNAKGSCRTVRYLGGFVSGDAVFCTTEVNVELVMWIVIGIVAVLGFIVLVPVLVVGTWYVVITVIMGLADGAIWLLDEGWRTIRGRKSRTAVQTKLLLGLGDANGKKQPIPVVTAPRTVTAAAMLRTSR